MPNITPIDRVFYKAEQVDRKKLRLPFMAIEEYISMQRRNFPSSLSFEEMIRRAWYIRILKVLLFVEKEARVSE